MALNTPANRAIQAWGDQGDGTFCNPVIWADFNNPWLMQAGGDFYLTAASHHFMGMPVLHSRDLVNWSWLGRVYDHLDYATHYAHPGQAYQRGSWAPALVQRGGLFMMYCMNSTDGLFLTTATDPAGPWAPVELIHRAYHWEDPFPFWDEDGQAYLIHSGFGGHAPLVIHRMNSDGRVLLDGGIVIEETLPNAHNPLMLKRDGYYYLFGVTRNTQIVFRSRQIYGPYEKRVLLLSDGVGSSPGGGGWIELSGGECWFMHHVGMTGHGRLPYLQPAGWKDGWPWIGANLNAEGAGEIAWRWPKPNTGCAGLSAPLNEPDDFVSTTLGPHWRWNHNPQPGKYSLTEHVGWLRLYACQLESEPGEDGVHSPVPYQPDSLIFAHNTLVQLPLGKRCQGTTILNVSGMETGQRAGLCLFNKDYFWIGVVQAGGTRRLRAATGENHWDGPQLSQDLLWLRAFVEDGFGRVAYSLDGADYKPLGPVIPLSIQWFEAHKFGLFSYNLDAEAGYADFDGFWQESLENNQSGEMHG
jgi:beta-xylosidase